MSKQEFGGNWTQDKLERIRRYLVEYTRIFTKSPSASFFGTIYVDAFAGTGYRTESRRGESEDSLFPPEIGEPDVQEFLKGSARIALEIEPSFGSYVLIEKSGPKVYDLEELKSQFPQMKDRIAILKGDANGELTKWCVRTDWRTHRAVVFLDPCGMQVDWNLIRTIAATKAIDLWILFPLGVAVNRMLTKGEKPPEKWAASLTRIFGEDKWKSEFYRTQVMDTLFGDQYTKEIKDADYRKIGDYFVRRLKTVFADAADNPLPLRNSKNVPLFLLCFAVGNPKGAPIAKRIASYILKK
jgi:three-Cys-motif partner protein